MAPRESQKRASLKWDKENMITLGCKIKREQATAFKSYCENQGKTSNTVLKEYVMDCISERDGGRIPSEIAQQVPEELSGAGVVSLPSEILEAAQRAAEAADEALPDFVARAVETQAKRDRSSLRLGINPATGGKLRKE